MGSYLYVESIKEGPICVLDPKSKLRLDLYKGLNKVRKDVWESCKSLPLIAAYLKAKTLEESKARCFDPAEKQDPKAVAKAMEDKKERDAKDKEDAKKREADKEKEAEDHGEDSYEEREESDEETSEESGQ